MTWPRAAPALAIAGVADSFKLFFNGFWFFGPAIAAWYCHSVVSGWVGSLWGLTAAACGAIAAAGGTFFSPTIAALGVVMAIATALLGFLSLALWFLMVNPRIFKTVKTAMMQISASFGFGAVPFVGAIPSFFPTVWKLYRRQIKLERAAYAKWEKENAAAIQQQQRIQLARAMQFQAAQQVQFQQGQMQEAANDAMYAEAASEAVHAEAANEAAAQERFEIGPVPGATTEAANDELPRPM